MEQLLCCDYINTKILAYCKEVRLLPEELEGVWINATGFLKRDWELFH
jgi:hypothetical protein